MDEYWKILGFLKKKEKLKSVLTSHFLETLVLKHAPRKNTVDRK